MAHAEGNSPALANGAETPAQSSTSMATDSAQMTAAKTQAPATKKTGMLDPANFPQHLSSESVYIELRYTPLDIPAALRFTRSPSCGANVLFLGTTRDNFDNRPVSRLSYSAYPALALKSLFQIAEDVRVKHGLDKVYIAHRLGEVAIEEESIAVSVSSGHRGAGWRGAEEVLELVKKRAEIWKREWFEDTGEGSWRANRDRDGEGRPVQRTEEKGKEVQQRHTAVDAEAEPERDSAEQPATQLESSGASSIRQADADRSRLTATHQTSKELDSDVADYIAAMTAKLRM